MATINLAPGTQFIITARRRRRRLYLMALGIAVIFSLIWLGLVLYARHLQQSLDAVNSQLRQVQLEIAKLEPDASRIRLFERRLQGMDSLLKTHISWEPVLQDLERLLPAESVLTLFDVNKDTGRVSLDGITPNIDQVAVTLASLVNTESRETVFTSGSLQSVKREETAQGEDQPAVVRYVFSAELKFDPTVVRRDKQL